MRWQWVWKCYSAEFQKIVGDWYYYRKRKRLLSFNRSLNTSTLEYLLATLKCEALCEPWRLDSASFTNEWFLLRKPGQSAGPSLILQRGSHCARRRYLPQCLLDTPSSWTGDFPGAKGAAVYRDSPKIAFSSVYRQQNTDAGHREEKMRSVEIVSVLCRINGCLLMH